MALKLSNGEELTAEREANLRKLAYFHLRGIESSPMGFDMAVYCVRGSEWFDSPGDAKNVCGTVGCLVGHGPSAGVRARRDEFWSDYSWRVFIPFTAESEWDWCFDDRWGDTDNTPAGGAKRILWLLERGLPPDWFMQMVGEAPLCYANWEPELPPEIRENVPERATVG